MVRRQEAEVHQLREASVDRRRWRRGHTASTQHWGDGIEAMLGEGLEQARKGHMPCGEQALTMYEEPWRFTDESRGDSCCEWINEVAAPASPTAY